jgi:hypothetical protein
MSTAVSPIRTCHRKSLSPPPQQSPHITIRQVELIAKVPVKNYLEWNNAYADRIGAITGIRADHLCTSPMWGKDPLERRFIVIKLSQGNLYSEKAQTVVTLFQTTTDRGSCISSSRPDILDPKATDFFPKLRNYLDVPVLKRHSSQIDMIVEECD